MTELSRRTLFLLCATLCCIVMVVTFLFTMPSRVFGANELRNTSNTGEQSPKVLLMQSGRLVEGKMNRTPGGFTVKTTSGTMLIPAKQVKHTAQNRTEIYNKLRKEVPNATTQQHLILARWCITNLLYSHAENELHAVLKKEPGQGDARKMLVRLKNITNPQNSYSEGSSKKKTEVTAALFVQDVRSLAGLSRKNANTYTRKVQPILVNKCSNAGCHGKSSKSKFKLIPVRSGRGSHRVFAEQNLAAILKQVDFKNPRHSPLLTKSKGGHGKNGRTVFNGRTGKKQQDILSKWIMSVVYEQEGSTVTPVSATKERQTPAFIEMTPNKQSEQKKFLKRIYEETEKDAFNPNEFNQQSKPR